MMDINAQKEKFSQAYVKAVAAVAGYTWSEQSVDHDSVDLTLAEKGGGSTIRSPKLDLQLKCQAAPTPSSPSLSYPLKLKNYNELCYDNVLVPRILVVVLVPDDVSDWMNHQEPEVALRRSGYWVSLRGLPETTNTTTVTVSLPRSQPFSPEQLQAMMQRIGSGGLP